MKLILLKSQNFLFYCVCVFLFGRNGANCCDCRNMCFINFNLYVVGNFLICEILHNQTVQYLNRGSICFFQKFSRLSDETIYL